MPLYEKPVRKLRTACPVLLVYKALNKTHRYISNFCPNGWNSCTGTDGDNSNIGISFVETILSDNELPHASRMSDTCAVVN